nr:SPOR domain-containing protein [Bacteroides ilei]
MKYLLLLIFFLSAAGANAQQTIVESLQTRRAGEGTVTIHQDASIASLIGSRYVTNGAEGNGQKTLKAKGFRVQVYAGNNSRVARTEANVTANKVKEAFPEMPVYTYFQPPRWLCRVGDFKTIEEAHAAMRKLKGSGEFKEVSIVREQINIVIEE